MEDIRMLTEIHSEIVETFLYKSQTIQKVLEVENSNKQKQLTKNLNLLIIVPKPKNVNITSNRWIFKKKYKTDSTICKYKARFIVRGYAQKNNIDYKETFSDCEI